MLNINRATVVNAKKVLSGGTSEEIAAVETGEAAVSAVARTIRRRGEPAVEEWKGEGTPESYVVSKNLHRRHLNESQRAMIAAKLATARSGERSDLGEISPTLENAADMLNVDRKTVVNAKKVLSGGTSEEIAAVETGEAAVSAVAGTIRRRGHETADVAPPEADTGALHTGVRIAVPDGMTPEKACRQAAVGDSNVGSALRPRRNSTYVAQRGQNAKSQSRVSRVR